VIHVAIHSPPRATRKAWRRRGGRALSPTVKVKVTRVLMEIMAMDTWPWERATRLWERGSRSMNTAATQSEKPKKKGRRRVTMPMRVECWREKQGMAGEPAQPRPASHLYTEMRRVVRGMNRTAAVRRAVARRKRRGRMEAKVPREKEYAEYTTAAMMAATQAPDRNTRVSLQATEMASAA
jgi:hypothetical protein